MKPLVSLITVNYRQAEVTLALLKSIRESQVESLEVILVDNDPTEWVDFESALPGIVVIRTKENLGFAGANNLGMAKAQGSHFLLVNNDTEINPNLINQLLSCFSDPRVGAVCPIIRYQEDPTKIQFAGFTPINSFTGRNELLKSLPSLVEETPYFHGAAVMISAEAVRKAGLMCESYFLYYEELDWSIRVRNAGYKILVSPDAFIDHKESISTGKNSPLKLYYQTRNRVHFMRRNSDTYLVFLIFFCMISFPKKWLSLQWNSEKPHLRAYIKAFRDGVVNPQYGMQDWAA
jgi:GT2 family glycosyltransferase